MATVAPLYPPRPANVPDNLTAPTSAFRFQALAVLGSIVLFAALYLGIMAGTPSTGR